MKRNAGWMLLAALCVLLCACRAQGSAVPAAAAGRYSGESVCIYGGERTPMDEVYSGESYLELREDGRGTLCLGGDEAEFRWQLDGTALTLTSGRETCRGTLENGRIETDLFGADIRLSFRQSAAPAQEPAQPEEAGPAAEESPEPDAISWPGGTAGTRSSTRAATMTSSRTAPGPPAPASRGRRTPGASRSGIPRRPRASASAK